MNQDPRYAAYAAMTDDQKAAHIRQHEAVLDTCVDLFEMLTGYIGTDVRAESTWGDVIFYAARYRWAKSGFSVDRRHPAEVQMDAIERGLKKVKAEFDGWGMDRELRGILEQHGVTEDRKV